MIYEPHDYQKYAINFIKENPIAALMTQIPGWKRGAAAKRLPLYGKQRIYEKG